MPQWRKFYVKTVDSLDINDMPDDFTRLLWILLPLGLDCEGRGIDNPAWINPKTAAERGIMNGDPIKVTSRVGEFTTSAYVTEGIVPGVIAISHSLGREHSGVYGSGNKSPSPGGARTAGRGRPGSWCSIHAPHS